MDSISVNYLGKLYDWGSISLTLLGSYQVGVNKIDIKNSRASDNVYGSGQKPIGYINKNFVYAATIGLLYDSFQEVVAAALAQGLSVLEIPPFQISMILGSTQDPLVPFLALTMQNCRFTNDDFSAKQNEGGFYNDYQISYAGIIKALA